MKDQDKTKEQLIHELENLRQRVVKHEAALKAEKRAMEGLRKSEKRYHTVYTIAPLAFVTWDLECRVTGWNDQAKNLFGWSQEEVLGRSFFDFLIVGIRYQYRKSYMYSDLPLEALMTVRKICG